MFAPLSRLRERGANMPAREGIRKQKRPQIAGVFLSERLL
ncbi:hypothetical protein CO2235_90006 [Cupriavidus oxalaticus]|uniref:Uncharacterized protein n=1 Tax=Cupriavidus oxalaticus TaxID=96344 RepID=A0A375GAV7_9BURK|nr:hypothetical protein CO2235_90006 [Cupriavidus oxalaticus]